MNHHQRAAHHNVVSARLTALTDGSQPSADEGNPRPQILRQARGHDGYAPRLARLADVLEMAGRLDGPGQHGGPSERGSAEIPTPEHHLPGSRADAAASGQGSRASPRKPPGQPDEEACTTTPLGPLGHSGQSHKTGCRLEGTSIGSRPTSSCPDSRPNRCSPN